VRPDVKKNPSPKWAGAMAQGVGPEFKPQYHKKKKKRKIFSRMINYVVNIYIWVIILKSNWLLPFC
jgi:hypothetical protein